MSAVAYDQRLATILAKSLARTPMTPNMVTTFGLLSGLAAAVMFGLGGPAGLPAIEHWAAAIFMYAVFNDHLDGELARTLGRTSRFGHYFDHFAASTTYVSMFVGVGVGRSGGALGGWAIVLGIAAGLAVVAIFLIRMSVEVRIGNHAVVQTSYGGFEIEDTLYIVGPVTWLGGLEPFLVAAGIGAPLFLLWVVWQARSEFREARRR